MTRLYRLTLLFSILFAFFLTAPALLSRQFGPYSLMKNGDVLDLLTPLILIPIYWLLFELSPETRPDRREIIVFLALAALWAMGHGMHLAANSIGHLLEGMEDSDVYTLTFFYDEELSHYLWHLGIVGLSVLLLFRQWRHPFANRNGGHALGILAGIIYGLTFFLVIVEGGTAVLGIIFAVLVTVFVLVRGQQELKHQPLLLFFFVSCLVTLLVIGGWAVYWGGLPEFSEVGIVN